MRILVIAAVAFVVCVVAAGSGMVLIHAPALVPGSETAQIEGKDLYGNELSLSEYQGKVVLVVFWTTNCESFQEFQTYLKDLQAKYEKRGFAIVGVNGDNSRAHAKAVAEQREFDYHSFYDGPKGPIARTWNVRDYPAFYVIDSRGEIVQQYDDFLLDFEIEQDIAKLLRAAGR
jgi:glutathione peroxidase-family protein